MARLFMMGYFNSPRKASMVLMFQISTDTAAVGEPETTGCSGAFLLVF